MMPPPTNPAKLKEPTEAEYLNPQGDEDEDLIESGAWDDEPDEQEQPEAPAKAKRKVHIHIHE